MSKTKIIFFSFPEFSGNSKYLYNYIDTHHKDEYDVFWYCKESDDESVYIKNKLRYIHQSDKKTKSIIETADIIFDTHGIALNYDLSIPIYVNLWHGIGPKKAGFLFNEKEMTEEDMLFSKKMAQNIDYFVTPSKFWNYIHGQLFNINHHRMLDLGSPRHEVLLNTKKAIKEFSGFDKIIFYVPTFMNNGNRKDDFGETKDNLLNLHKYEEEKLFKYLNQNNFLLVIRFHPSDKRKDLNINHPNILFLDNKFLNNRDTDLYELLSLSDLLITDYSSIYFDYLVLNKPIIFAHANKESYAQKRGYIFNNYDFWFLETKVETLKQLVKMCNELLNSSKTNSNEIKKFANSFLGKDYYKTSSKASKNIHDYFFTAKFKLRKNISKSDSSKMVLELKETKKDNQIIKIENENLKQELSIIVNSKGWRLLEKLRKIFRRRGK